MVQQLKEIQQLMTQDRVMIESRISMMAKENNVTQEFWDAVNIRGELIQADDQLERMIDTSEKLAILLGHKIS